MPLVGWSLNWLLWILLIKWKAQPATWWAPALLQMIHCIFLLANQIICLTGIAESCSVEIYSLKYLVTAKKPQAMYNLFVPYRWWKTNRISARRRKIFSGFDAGRNLHKKPPEENFREAFGLPEISKILGRAAGNFRLPVAYIRPWRE